MIASINFNELMKHLLDTSATDTLSSFLESGDRLFLVGGQCGRSRKHAWSHANKMTNKMTH